MSTAANVQSSEAIEVVRRSLLSFLEQVDEAVTTLDLEMRHVLEWVEHDRPRHWKTQIRLAFDELNEAQAALHRCLMFPKTVNERPACYEERQAVKKAQARLDYCQRKADRVRHWKRALPHEVSEYQGRMSRLKRLVEFEIPQAVAVLEKILRHLEAYSAIHVGPAQSAYNDVALVGEIWPEKPMTRGEPDAPAPLTANAAPIGETTPSDEAASSAGPPATASEEA
jgi:hypothetical protein